MPEQTIEQRLDEILAQYFTWKGDAITEINQTANYKRMKQAIQALITLHTQKREVEAQTNAVAWTIGVLDDMHSHVGEDGLYREYDLYKGIKNTIRDRYKDMTGVDPAPSYPIHAQLTNPTEAGEK